MKLILTDEEKAANTWLELDDAALGKVVKATALKLKGYEDQRKVWFMAAALVLCNMVHEVNATTFTQELSGVTMGDEQRGDWKLTIKRIRKP